MLFEAKISKVAYQIQAPIGLFGISKLIIITYVIEASY
jgi:hypothetical protein